MDGLGGTASPAPSTPRFKYLLARDTFSVVRHDETTFCKEMPDGTFPGPMHGKETLARRKTLLFQNCSYLCRHFLVSLAKRFALLSYPVYNHPVGPVHRARVERGEINLRDPLRAVAQAVADHRNRHLLGSGQARPRMPRAIHRQGFLQA